MSRLILLLTLTLAVAVGHAAPLLSLSVQPAWNGVIKPGAPTEIAVTLLADRNGPATVTVPGHEPRLRVTTELTAHRPRTVWLGVRAPVAAPLRVNARMAGAGTATASVRFESVAEDARLIANTLSLPSASSPPGLHAPVLLNASATALPRTSAGYGAIAAVILDGDGLAALDTRQAASLQGYGADCGRIVLVGPTPPRFDALSTAAGCGGRFIARVKYSTAALAAVQAMPTGGTTELPTANRLQTMANSDPFKATWSALVLFFILYAIGLTVTLRGARRVAPLLLVPVLAALLSWTAWSNDKAGRRLISWSEMNAHGHTLRYTALLQISGAGKGEARTELPAGFGMAQPQAPDAAAEIDRTDDGTTPVLLKSRNFLLSQVNLFTHGNMPVEPTVDVSMTRRGPVVENRGTATTPPALLGWNDRRDPVPPLRPGERWSPPEKSTPWNVSRVEEQLLRTRSQAGTPAVLMPHRLLPHGSGDPPIEDRGWLLIVGS